MIEYWGRRSVVEWDDYNGCWYVGVGTDATGAAVNDATVIGDRYRNPDLWEASATGRKSDAEYGIQAIAKNLEQLYHDFRRIAK